MIDGKYCIGIMSIGSGVGQSVITSCNLSRLPLKTIGLGMNSMAFGAYECDEMDDVPIIYSDHYIAEVIDQCQKHSIDLIIPGSDDEAFILANNKTRLEEKGIKVLVSDSMLISLIRDKAKMCDQLSRVADIFVKSYDNKDVRTFLERGTVNFPLIAKPRDGFASKGIEILLNENDLNRLTDKHIVQELAIPHSNDPFRELYLAQISNRINPQISEISIQIVANRHGEIFGRMASYNKLNNGVPIEIIPYENESIWSDIDQLIPHLKNIGLKGPLNIQGRLTDNGFKIFEMNARFTGITGLRAIMGFNEVEACIKDWLDLPAENDALQLNYDRFGIRQTTDKAVSFDKNIHVKNLSSMIQNKAIKTHKTVLVTGASGYLGQMLVDRLSLHDYEIWALGRTKTTLQGLYAPNTNVKCHDFHDIQTGNLSLGLVDIIIHSGFARPHKGNEAIAESLKFTNELFMLAAQYQVPIVVNISSQSVYGTKQPILWTEDTPVSPETLYAQAKLCTELMAANIKVFCKHSDVTSLRLSSLSGGQKGLVPVDLIAKFIEKAINDETIEIIDGTQNLQRLDVRDAADAIVALLGTDSSKWSHVYNLGTNEIYTVNEIVDCVARVSNRVFGKNVKIEKFKKDVHLNLGMDSTKFYEFSSWKPQYNLENTVVTMYEYFTRGEI